MLYPLSYGGGTRGHDRLTVGCPVIILARPRAGPGRGAGDPAGEVGAPSRPGTAHRCRRQLVSDSTTSGFSSSQASTASA